MKRPRRCFGIDWLEIFVNESPQRDYTPEGFRGRGWVVEERDYGTKTMAQVFTLKDNNGHPFVEIRRAPRGLNTPADNHIYKEGDAYVKLSNMYCYDENPVDIICQFLNREKYSIIKIYRIDLYMDFAKFDTGDLPRNVARRIVNHTYAKVNQTHRRCSGEDTWTECRDNWLAWGAPGSMVSTKFYDKSKEIREVSTHKTWILENWRRCGLIDGVTAMLKDGAEVNIWRLEFAIKGNAKGWIYIDKSDSEDGCRHMLPHTLALYAERKGVLNAIANLIPYYFRFKIYVEGVRKSRCKEKELFRFAPDEFENGYRVTSESDAGRVRAVQVDDDIIALKHLVRAFMKVSSASMATRLQQMITELDDTIKNKSQMRWVTDKEIWRNIWPLQ